MVNYKPIGTPLKAQTKFSSNDTHLDDPSHFQKLVGSLLYLTLTRPDLTYNVNFLSQFMHAPTVTHLKMIRRISQFLKGILKLVCNSLLALHLIFCFLNADCAGCLTTRRSTIGYCIVFGNNLISWCAKKQHTISCSSTEAEYRAMANTIVKLTWLDTHTHTHIYSHVRSKLLAQTKAQVNPNPT